jgi:hypothetical protein
MGNPPATRCTVVPGQYQLRLEWSIPTLFGFVTLHKTMESLPFRVISTVNSPEAQ